MHRCRRLGSNVSILTLRKQKRSTLYSTVFPYTTLFRSGEVSHYAADFFTFPHNESYHGNIKDHCKYEKELKQTLKSYLRDSKNEIEKIDVIAFKSIDQLMRYFKQSHREYLKRRNTVEEDCKYITKINFQLMQGISQLFKDTLAINQPHNV